MMPWRGVFPAVTTKMSEAGAVDVKATQRSIERLITSGAAGVIVLPMLGEHGSLTSQEREAVLCAAAEVVNKRVPLLSGLAEMTLDAARKRARAYQRLGAEGLMVFPSLGYRSDPRETIAWYRGIASASSLPIMIYNNPSAYGVDVTPAILERLANVEEIVCVKEETGDSRRVSDLLAALGNRFSVFCGIDDLLLETVSLGATGWVSGMANAWPVECVRLFGLCAAGDLRRARALNQALMPAFHLDAHVKLVQYVKLAESLVYGAPEWTRSPRLALVGEEREAVIRTIKDTIEKLKLLDPN